MSVLKVIGIILGGAVVVVIIDAFIGYQSAPETTVFANITHQVVTGLWGATVFWFFWSIGLAKKE